MGTVDKDSEQFARFEGAYTLDAGAKEVLIFIGLLTTTVLNGIALTIFPLKRNMIL